VSVVTVFYSALGGFKGVVITDFVQFTFAMIGAVWAAIFILNMPEVGGLDNLFAHANVSDKLDIIPSFDDPAVYVPLLMVERLVPGGGTRRRRLRRPTDAGG